MTVIRTHFFTYILTTKKNTALYTGVTSDIVNRLKEHREGYYSGFTKRYNIHKLVYYELHDSIEYAIDREKQIKAGSRRKKIDLIESINPEWKDLFDKVSSLY